MRTVYWAGAAGSSLVLRGVGGFGSDRWLYKWAGKLNVGAVDLTVEDFKQEMASALKSYDRHVVCLEKIPEDCEKSIRSLMEKAIKAYVGRGANMRHGIALDRQLTIILSQTDGPKPLCGIYFNLHSPYSKKASGRAESAKS